MGFEEETVGGERTAQQAREDRVAGGRSDARREHQQVRPQHQVAVRRAIVYGDLQLAALFHHHRVTLLRMADEQHAGLARLLEVQLAESVSAYVTAQHHYPGSRQAALDLQRILHRFRAAHTAAVRVLVVAALDALDHDHGGIGPGAKFGRKNSAGQRRLEFALRGDVRVLAVEVGRGWTLLPAGGHDHHAVADG